MFGMLVLWRSSYYAEEYRLKFGQIRIFTKLLFKKFTSLSPYLFPNFAKTLFVPA